MSEPSGCFGGADWKTQQHLPRIRWPYGALPNARLELLVERARRGDEDAWHTILTLIDRRELTDSILDKALQACIAVLTLTGLYFIGSADPSMRWYGAWISLAAQPFWLADSWRGRRAGNFLIALVFTALWLRMIYTGW